MNFRFCIPLSFSLFLASSSFAQVSSTVSGSSLNSMAPAPILQKEISVLPSNKETDRKSKYDLDLKVTMRGRSIEDEFVKSRTAGTGIKLSTGAQLSKKLYGKLGFGGTFAAGSTSNLFTKEGEPSSYIYLDEASLNLAPSDWSFLRAGVIETGLASNASSFLRMGLPGIAEGVKIGSDSMNFGLVASQVIPTAVASAKTSTANSSTPALAVFTAEASFGKEDADVNAGLSASYFSFSGLPANAAQDSRFLGNTVVGIGAAAARFAYQFHGYETSAIARARVNRAIKLELKGSVIDNTAAPNDIGRGYNVAFTPTLEVGDMSLEPTAGYFYLQSDALPASYSSLVVGNNNRSGLVIGLKTTFKEENFSVRGTWVQANEIKDNPYMSDRQILTVTVETNYDIL